MEGAVRQQFRKALRAFVAAENRDGCGRLWETALSSRSISDAEQLCRLLLGPNVSWDVNPLPDGQWLAEINYDHVLYDGCGSDAVEAMLVAMCSVLDGMAGP
jgi:hypothetical protein